MRPIGRRVRYLFSFNWAFDEIAANAPAGGSSRQVFVRNA